MTETTTIQVRKDQAKKLKEIQGPSGNYKTAIDTVLEGHMKYKRQDSDVKQVMARLDELEEQIGEYDES